MQQNYLNQKLPSPPSSPEITHISSPETIQPLSEIDQDSNSEFEQDTELEQDSEPDFEKNIKTKK